MNPAVLPPLVYGFLVWRQFDFVDPSGYIPYEEARQALAGGDLPGFLGTPLLSMNMTSGALLSNMYDLTFGQSILTIALGVAIALNLIAHLDLRRVCRVTGFTAPPRRPVRACWRRWRHRAPASWVAADRELRAVF